MNLMILHQPSNSWNVLKLSGHFKEALAQALVCFLTQGVCFLLWHHLEIHHRNLHSITLPGSLPGFLPTNPAATPHNLPTNLQIKARCQHANPQFQSPKLPFLWVQEDGKTIKQPWRWDSRATWESDIFVINNSQLLEVLIWRTNV